MRGVWLKEREALSCKQACRPHGAPPSFTHTRYDFIGVAPLHGADMERVLGLRRRNATPKRVNELFGPMLNKTEHLLREFYRQWNARLATHLRDLGYLWAADDTAAAE